MSFTGFFVKYAPKAAIVAQGVAWSSFPPKAPPNLKTSTSTLFIGIPNTFAIVRCTAVGLCVDEIIFSSLFSFGIANAPWVSRYKCS